MASGCSRGAGAITNLFTIFIAIWGGSTLMIMALAAAARISRRVRAHLLPIERDQADADSASTSTAIGKAHSVPSSVARCVSG